VDELDQKDLHDLKRKRKKEKKPKFTIPKPPSKSAPPGPAYSPQTFTFTSFTQYFANLTRIHNINLLDKKQQKKPSPTNFDYEVEYASNNDTHYKLPDLTVRNLLDLAQRIAKEEVKKEVKQNDCDPSAHELQDFEDGDASPWLDLVEKTAKNHVWRAFVKRAFVCTKPEKYLDDRFG
jgi:endopolyphosphatase